DSGARGVEAVHRSAGVRAAVLVAYRRRAHPEAEREGVPRQVHRAAADARDRVTRPRLLVLDTSYSLEAIRANRTEASVTCRDLGGFFDRVWTVHPFATL